VLIWALQSWSSLLNSSHFFSQSLWRITCFTSYKSTSKKTWIRDEGGFICTTRVLQKRKRKKEINLECTNKMEKQKKMWILPLCSSWHKIFHIRNLKFAIVRPGSSANMVLPLLKYIWFTVSMSAASNRFRKSWLLLSHLSNIWICSSSKKNWQKFWFLAACCLCDWRTNYKGTMEEEEETLHLCA
jgi:hypothetical protein